MVEALQEIKNQDLVVEVLEALEVIHLQLVEDQVFQMILQDLELLFHKVEMVKIQIMETDQVVMLTLVLLVMGLKVELQEMVVQEVILYFQQ